MLGALADTPLPAEMFRRPDESPDAEFYVEPRLVTHIDDATIAALTGFYRERLPPDADLLDLMSSWISHLPAEVPYGRVEGLGMNARELGANPRLSGFAVHDLNREPDLPYPEASFDAVLNAVSIQYLTRPLAVYRSVACVLRPGGLAVVALSHRLFPTKAIAAFQALPPRERIGLVRLYFERAGGFEPAEFVDRSPEGADPLWIVTARRL
ncbi:MAG: class I SAM-dependent methyltransferase [Deltaproteobacteria bacterium]|nr:class I SAM-dependent methyltransferase [Deltaproteobacteria bacterium]